jgi:MFS family permease
MTGISTDLLVYSCIIPVMPFQLQKLGYSDVSSRVGWLLFAYVCHLFSASLQLQKDFWSTLSLQVLLYVCWASACDHRSVLKRLIATIPIAMFSERYNVRQMPLIIGLVILAGSQVMLMEAPLYAVMCIARILQGAGSSMVWVVGLALVCGNNLNTYI